MTVLESAGLGLLRAIDPERAHGIALAALRLGLAPAPGLVPSERLRTSIAGLGLANPVGLAAGFDKNATALHGLERAGFGVVEVGATTPRPQPGNPKPRRFDKFFKTFSRILGLPRDFQDFCIPRENLDFLQN